MSFNCSCSAWAVITGKWPTVQYMCSLWSVFMMPVSYVNRCHYDSVDLIAVLFATVIELNSWQLWTGSKPVQLGWVVAMWMDVNGPLVYSKPLWHRASHAQCIIVEPVNYDAYTQGCHMSPVTVWNATITFYDVNNNSALQTYKNAH